MQKKILMLFLLSVICNSIIQLQNLDQLTITDLQLDQFIKVSQSSDVLCNLDGFQNKYYTLAITNKNKRKAYDLFKYRYGRTVSTLKEFGIIGNQKTLIKSKLKSRYIYRAKLWQFGIVFCLQQRNFKLQHVQIKLEELGIRILKDTFQIDYLQDKLIASRIYNYSKLRLQKILQKLGGDYEIKYVDDLEIDGVIGYEDSNQIEEELQNEDVLIPKHIQVLRSHYDSTNNTAQIQKKIKIDATFRIGRKSNVYVQGQYRNYNQSHLNWNASELKERCQQKL